MSSGRFDLNSDSASERPIPSHSVLRRTRLGVLLVLMLFGLHLLAAGSGAGNSHTMTAQQAAFAHMSIQTAQVSASRTPLSVGMGAGTSSGEKTGAAPLDSLVQPV